MAESVFTYMVKQRGLEKQFKINSAATSTEEIGNSPHYGTVSKLKAEGIPLVPHRAVQMTNWDYDDYDYLIQGRTRQSQRILNSPYVFHTYVYAIENFQCYAPSLHNVCVSVTLNDHRIFDFRDYFQQFSEAIFPLFVWSVMVYRNGNYSRFSITDFCRIADPGGFSVQNPAASINNVKRKVRTKINDLQRQFPDAKEEYLRTKDDILALGVTPQTTYLYIQGHHLFDTVVSPILSKVCNLLRQERQNEIYHASAHRTQKRNEMSCYENSLQDIKTMLKKNTGYMSCEQFQRLQSDIHNYLGTD